MRRLAGWAGRACAVGAAVVMVAWMVGRVVSDRSMWLQPLSWMPSALVLGAAVIGLVLWGGLSRWARRGAVLNLRARWAQRGVWWVWAAGAAYVIVFEWHGLRYLSGRGEAGAVRILVWNPAQMKLDGFGKLVLGEEPDIVMVANAPLFTQDWPMIRAGLGGTGGAVQAGWLSMTSRYPVRRWGQTALGITKSVTPGMKMLNGVGLSNSGGDALWVELETTNELGRPIVVWLVDLPADPSLSRWRMMGEAAEAVAAWQGPVYVRGARGEDLVEQAPRRGFPPPDVVVGDFNTPRGSASFARLVGGMRHAYDDAGRGWAATFPDEWPLVAIDQVFVGADLRATRYEVVNLGGRHRAQRVEIAPAGKH